ncbi:MAG: class IV adenylate cyclase [Bacteroidia bacterium]|nr:class IV adenylate cyclase [Bacteroidia bacterium]
MPTHMQEIEVKILEVDPSDIIARLTAAGATLRFDGEMYALFYDDSQGNITARGDVLRLRREGPETVLAYKRHISRDGAKVMEETETQVTSLEALHTILTQTGLQVIKKTRKHRIQYDLGDTHIVLDTYQDELAAIPTFMEIEAPDLTRLREVAALLGYTPEACLSWSTYELVKHYHAY